jgi:hypothetical protein
LPSAKYPQLFVVTYGRSGSTLLMNLLNSIPGYRIFGENGDVAGSLMKFQQNASHFDPQKHKIVPATEPWFGFEKFTRANYAAGCRRLMDSFLLADENPGTVRSYGFKEIRYSPADVRAKIDFLRLLYPQAGFILNKRDAEQVVRSKFMTQTPIEEIRQMNAIFGQIGQNRDYCFLIDYRDVTGCTERLGKMFEFLGETFDLERCKQVLSVRHSVGVSS